MIVNALLIYMALLNEVLDQESELMAREMAKMGAVFSTCEDKVSIRQSKVL